MVNQAYQIRVEGEGNGFWTVCHAAFDNFVLEFEVRMEQGTADSLVGVMFRVFTGSSYNLYLTGGNRYCWTYYDAEADDSRALANCGEPLPAGARLENTVRVRLVVFAEKMALFVDENLVAEASHFALDYGRFGFFVIHSGEAFTEVAIDNILIRSVTPADLIIFSDGEQG